MAETVDLTPDNLRKHARELRDFAEDLRQANTSAASRDLYAYGAIGLIWANTMNDRFDKADEFTGEAVKAAERVAAQLDAMATDYANADTATRTAMDKISESLS